jgi:cellulose biosynthesis protein BcsQ
MSPLRVITVASNKGGVGKTTLATNLAVYIRALCEDLPILVLGLDDQDLIDRMFGLDAAGPERTILDALRDGDLTPAIRLGQYGVHYVSSSPAISNLESGLSDPFALRRLLERSGWSGLVVVDTKSDLGILTQNALAASDLALVAVSDRTSLDQAERIYALLDGWERPRERAWILLSLVDRRVKFRAGEDRDILGLLVSEVRRRGHPLLESFVSRSPKIESLYTNPEGRAQSVLHGAQGSLIHRQMAHLAQDVLHRLEALEPLAFPAPAEPAASALTPSSAPVAVGPRPSPGPRLWTVEELLGTPEPEEPQLAEPPLAAQREIAPADRRRLERRPFARRIPGFRLEDPPIVALDTRDLSTEGVGVVGPSPLLRAGSRVHLALGTEADGEPLLVWGQVIRSQASDVALRFDFGDEEGVSARLARFVADLEPEPTAPSF